jgi:hypothetical protein
MIQLRGISLLRTNPCWRSRRMGYSNKVYSDGHFVKAPLSQASSVFVQSQQF